MEACFNFFLVFFFNFRKLVIWGRLERAETEHNKRIYYIPTSYFLYYISYTVAEGKINFMDLPNEIIF